MNDNIRQKDKIDFFISIKEKIPAYYDYIILKSDLTDTWNQPAITASSEILSSYFILQEDGTFGFKVPQNIVKELDNRENARQYSDLNYIRSLGEDYLKKIDSIFEKGVYELYTYLLNLYYSSDKTIENFDSLLFSCLVEFFKNSNHDYRDFVAKCISYGQSNLKKEDIIFFLHIISGVLSLDVYSNQDDAFDSYLFSNLKGKSHSSGKHEVAQNFMVSLLRSDNIKTEFDALDKSRFGTNLLHLYRLVKDKPSLLKTIENKFTDQVKKLHQYDVQKLEEVKPKNSGSVAWQSSYEFWYYIVLSLLILFAIAGVVINIYFPMINITIVAASLGIISCVMSLIAPNGYENKHYNALAGIAFFTMLSFVAILCTPLLILHFGGGALVAFAIHSFALTSAILPSLLQGLSLLYYSHNYSKDINVMTTPEISSSLGQGLECCSGTCTNKNSDRRKTDVNYPKLI